MQNPLTRGKGIKPIQIVKGLTGRKSVYGSLSSTHPNPRFKKSPEMGLGHVIRDPRQNKKTRDLPFSCLNPSLCLLTSGSKLPSFDLLFHLSCPLFFIVPLSYGFFFYGASLPDLLSQLPFPEEKSLVALAVLVGALVLAATFTGAAAMRARRLYFL